MGPSGLPSTFSHPLPFPLCLDLFLMGECGSDINTNKLIRTATSLEALKQEQQQEQDQYLR